MLRQAHLQLTIKHRPSSQEPAGPDDLGSRDSGVSQSRACAQLKARRLKPSGSPPSAIRNDWGSIRRSWRRRRNRSEPDEHLMAALLYVEVDERVAKGFEVDLDQQIQPALARKDPFDMTVVLDEG